MKKNVLFLFSVFSLLLFMAGCSDDDTNGSGERWKDISQTYEGSKLEVKINGNTVILSGKHVELNASSATEGMLTLANILPDASSCGFKVQMEGTGDVKVSGETTLGNASISASGTIDKTNRLVLDISRRVNSAVTNDWNMFIRRTGENSSAALYIKAKTGDPLLDALFPMVDLLVGPMITEKVSNVTAFLGEDGMFDVNWTKVGEEEVTTLPTYLTAFLRVYYLTEGDVLYLAIDKNYIELIQDILPLVGDLGFDLDVEKIVALLTDLGGYYAIPIHFMQEGDQTTFYVTKELLVPLIDMVAPMLLADLDEAIAELVNNLLASIPNAEQLDFGMIFEKAID